MNHEQLAHVWAQGDSSRNLKATNMFLENNVIYSYGYHFPIAKHCGNYVMLTNASYSHSTSKHIGYVRHAIPLGVEVFEVEHVLADTKVEHKKNYKHLLDQAAEALDVLAKGRTDFDYRFSVYRGYLEAANAYSKKFKLGYRAKPVPSSIDDIGSLMADRKEAIKKANAKQREAERKRKARQAKEFDKQEKEWLAHERSTLNWERHRAGRPTLLRLSKDGESVETSRQASFPVDHAKKAWRFIKALKKSGKDYSLTGRGDVPTIRVGVFTINSVSHEGDVVAGCHELKHEIMAEFAKKMGW